MNLPWVNRFFLGKSLWCDHSLYLAGKLQIIKSAPYMTHQRNSIQAYHLLIKSRSAVFYPFSKLWTQTHDFPTWCNCGFKHCRKGRSTKEKKKPSFHNVSIKFLTLNRFLNSRDISVLKDVAQSKFCLINLSMDRCSPRPLA